MRASRILVVDDSEILRVAVTTALREHGFDVTARADGGTFERDLHDLAPDLLILDVMLPGRDGFDLLAAARRVSFAGVLMLTARDAVGDRLHGLRLGADDYLAKPFAMAELVARARAILRRTHSGVARQAVVDLVLAADSDVVQRDGQPIPLTPTERRLLGVLVDNAGDVVSKTQLLNTVWGIDDAADNLVEVNISALRRKLEKTGPRLIHTVRGRGYSFGDTSPGAPAGQSPSA